MEKGLRELPSQEFRHSELQSNASIRLIQIHPELLRGEMSCTLQHFETDTQTCPDYTALSYVWGDSTRTETIYINGLAQSIHRSLWELLSHIQSTEGTEHTWYWTDLLCIDQTHHSEKNEQIARMGDIYAQAAHVTSWLGNRYETAEALRVLSDVSEDSVARYGPGYGWTLTRSQQILEASYQLAEEPYWERVWILQEILLVRDCIVACGNVSIDFDDLVNKMQNGLRIMKAMNPVSSHRKYKMKHFQALVDLKTSIQQRERINFVKLITKTSACRATRDQDMVYGLLRLASRLDPEFDPNALGVSQHKTLYEVWWDIIFMVLENPDISSIKNRIGSLNGVIGQGQLPRKRWELTSTIRRTHAETAFQISRAVYSQSTPFGTTRIRAAWNLVATHVYNNALDVPGLQTSLGWSAYAGLWFTSWHNDLEEAPETIRNHRPLGWFCAAHMPEPLSEISAKHLIPSTNYWMRHISPFVCTGAENHEARCDLSSAVLKIEQLGITCLVQSMFSNAYISFYCDCCRPSTGSSRPSLNLQSWVVLTLK